MNQNTTDTRNTTYEITTTAKAFTVYDSPITLAYAFEHMDSTGEFAGIATIPASHLIACGVGFKVLAVEGDTLYVRINMDLASVTEFEPEHVGENALAATLARLTASASL